jgi:hypothetical protein
MKKKPLPTGSKESFRKFIKHPIVLLILGASTGLGGQWLVSSWQRREWDRQQSRLLTIKNLDQKYQLPQELLKASEQFDSAMTSYLFWLETQEIKGRYGSDPEDHGKILVQANDAWYTTWIIIEQKLKLFYKKQEIQSLFDKIETTREQISGNAFVLHAQFLLGEEKRLTKEMRDTIKETKELLVENFNKIRELIAMMTTETSHDMEGH